MPRTPALGRVTAVALAVTALLACAACADQTTVVPSGSAPTSAAASSVPASPSPNVGKPGQQQLDTAADAVSRLGGSHPDVFTGLAVDVPNGRLIVYRKPGGGGFDAALAQLGLSVRLDLRNAPRSISELTATRNRVLALMGHTSGYSIATVGDGSVASFARGVVEVGVAGDLSRAKADLGGRFGDRVAVSAAQPISD